MRTASLFLGKTFSKLGRASTVRLDRACEFLRGIYPTKTAERVEDDTGGQIGAETVRKWLQGKSKPNGDAVVLLSAVYGPAFLLFVMVGPTDWMTEAGREQARRQINAEIDGLEGFLEELS